MEFRDFDPSKVTFVAIGSGHGLRTTEREIIQRTPNLISIVGGQWDDRGHTGDIRKNHGMPGIGDIVTRMSNHFREQYDQDTFDFRWNGPWPYHGQRPKTAELAMHISRLGVLTGVRKMEQAHNGYLGRVIPVTDQVVDMEISYINGETRVGEGLIDDHQPEDPPIKSVQAISQNGKLTTNPEVIEAFDAADMVILGPGTVHSNKLIYQHPGIPQAINESHDRGVPVICLVNSFNKPETRNWTASRHLKVYTDLGIKIDQAIVPVIKHPIPQRYYQEGYQQIEIDSRCHHLGVEVVPMEVTQLEDFEDQEGSRKVIKHNGVVVVDYLYKLLNHVPNTAFRLRELIPV